jgi:Tetratricopeptide repeat
MHLDEIPSDTEKEIRLYLLDQLPPSEKQALEARIAQDPDYALVVEEMRWMMSLAQVARHDRMQAQVQAAGARARSAPGWTRGVYLSAAAAVALLAAFGAYWWLRPPEWRRLANRYNTRPLSYEVVMGAGSDRAFSIYNEAVKQGPGASFDAAITALRAIPETDSSYNTAQYYLAQSYLGNQDPQSAIAVFQGYLMRTSESELLYHDAKWYLVLALLHVDRVKEAKDLLLELSRAKEFSKPKDVQDLLQALP